MSTKVHFPPVLKSLLFVAILFLFFLGSSFAQEQQEGQESESAEIVPEAIEIDDISSELEKLGLRILKLQAILKPSFKVIEIDSLLTVLSKVLKLERDTLLLRIENLSQRNLKVQNVEWEEHKSKLKEYQSTLDSRLGSVTNTNEELVEAIGTWEITREVLKEREESAEIFISLENTISILNELRDNSRIRIDSIFLF